MFSKTIIFPEKWILISTLLFTLLYSCKNTDSKIPVDEFSHQKYISLKGDVVKLNSDTILNHPLNITVLDSLGIFYENTQLAGYSIINLNNGNLIRRFAFSGNNPWELNTNSLIINPMPGDNKRISVFQNNIPRRFFVYDIDSLLKDSEYKPSFSNELPNNISVSDGLLMNDSLAIGISRFLGKDRNQFAAINTKAKKLKTAIPLPEPNDPYSQKFFPDSTYYSWLVTLLGGELKYRPKSKSEFAYFSYNGTLLNIFKVDKSGHFSLSKQKLFQYPKFEVLISNSMSKGKIDKEALIGFLNISVTSDKIFTLYSGKKKADENSYLSDKVLVYDWELNPIQSFTLDRQCYYISVDQNNPTKLYGISGKENSEIVRYDLP